MINRFEKAMSLAASLPLPELQKIYSARLEDEEKALVEQKVWLQEEGFIQLDAVPETMVLPDGREVLHLGDEAWVLRLEIHEQRREEALEQARQRDEFLQREQARSDLPAEALATTTCPQIINGHVCGGSLQQSAICPRCDLGRAGYTHRYTCEACGYDIATRRPA